MINHYQLNKTIILLLQPSSNNDFQKHSTWKLLYFESKKDCFQVEGFIDSKTQTAVESANKKPNIYIEKMNQNKTSPNTTKHPQPNKTSII